MARSVLISILTVLMAIATGCSGTHHYDSRLVEADSLMKTHPDSALALVEALPISDLSTEGDRAYRDLLLTQARYKCYITATTDSDINRALTFYRHHKNDHEKLTRAYIYKGAVMEELGHPDSAMHYYKTAETTADSDDYFNRGFCHLRIGTWYQYHFASEDSAVLSRIRKAIECFNACQDTNYIMISTGILGAYMNNIDKDSAKIYLRKAISLAQCIHSSEQFSYQSKLAGIYFYQKDYPKTKELTMDIINNGRHFCYENMFYYYAARSFIKLGNMDSAYWVKSIIPAPLVPLDSFNHYLLQSELAEANNNIVEYNRNKAIAERIHRRMIESNSNSALLIKEFECDASLKQEQLTKEHNEHILLIILVVSLLLIIVLLMTRRRIHNKENEFRQELDLAQQEIRRMVDESEKQIAELLAERKKDKAQLKQINKELSRANKNCRQLEQKDQNIHERASAIVRARNAALNELYDDIRIVIKSDSEDGSRKWMPLSSLFKEYHESRKIQLLTPRVSFWKKLKAAVDLEFDGIATFVEKKYPQLTMSELHLFWLSCAKVPSQVIKICMKYSTAVTVSNNKKRLMRDKIGMDIRVDDFIKMYLNRELEK